MTHTHVTRAIDVGYGNTKFTTASTSDEYGCQIIPSIAPTATQQVQVAGGMLAAAQYVSVEVDGKFYAVGTDAVQASNGKTSRILSEQFALTNDYLALVRGCLYYMAQPKIDMLVLGLPMNTFQNTALRDQLRERMTGGHTVPNPALRKNKSAPPYFSVEVGAVRILPQPVGAFFNYCLPRGLYNEMNAQTNLVLDVGYGTFDWFLAFGNRPLAARCGAYFGGVSQVVKDVADAHHPKAKENLHVLNAIDEAIRTGKTAQIGGKDIDVAAVYKTVIEDTIRKAVDEMVASVNNTLDVTNILLTGGGASIYREQIQRVFPDRELIIDTDPVFSNVRGFQACGENWAKSLKAAA